VRDEQASTWRRGLRTPGLEVPYRQLLRATLQRPWLGVGLSLALPVAGFAAATTLDEQFFPPADRDQFQVQLWLPQQSTLEQTSAAMAELRRVALTHPQVHAFVGASAPKFYYNIPEGTEGAPYYAQALVQLHGNEGVPDVVRSLQRELDLALPAAQVVVRLLEQGPPFDAPLEVRVVGPDLDQLDRLGRELRAVLAAVPGVVHTRATLDADRPKLWLEPRDADLAPAGWDRVSLAQTLEAALEGRTAGSLLEATEELPVRVRLGADQRGTLEQILSLPLATPGAGAGWTPLGALATVRSEPELGAIRRRDRERENTVQGYLEAGILPSVGLARFRAQLDRQPVALPDGYRLEIGGESAERDDAVGNLLAFAGILLVMMGASQVLAFRSFRAAAIIGVVGFLSVGLALLALWAFQYPFGFMAIIGTMGLIGVAINDSIVVLSALRADPSAAAGDAQACERVVLRATRHVLATTATTMAGFTPLVLSGGLFWPPLAVALGFGVVGSTLLGLFFVPSVHRWSVRRWSVRRA
jgi:multidrug efflux pump subunit AcrB